MLLQYVLFEILNTLTGHLIFVTYLLAVTDEQSIWKRLKKLPPLLLSPLTACLIELGLNAVLPESDLLSYFINSSAILAMCTLWTAWAWRWSFLRAFSATCMAAILQVASTSLAQIVFLILPSSRALDFPVIAASAFCLSAAAAALLKRMRFGAWFRLLLEDQPDLPRTAVLVFALLVSMETFLLLQKGVEGQYLAAYYVLVLVLVIVTVALMVYLAHRSDDIRTLQNQRDIIAQQQLYEHNLEDIRREVRSFRHDYKNLLAGLSQHVEEGELDALRSSLSELDADFDRRLGEKIQFSIQIGNLRVPQIRSLLLSKLSAMRKKGVDYRLEIMYPVEAVSIDVWDFVRCLGILLDNAAEAALDTGRPWVEIILLVQGGRTYLRVSNPYANAIDPRKMWEEGWSTKGTGRGLGLPSYQRILENYPNASPCASWENGVFVQELTLEDRP